MNGANAATRPARQRLRPGCWCGGGRSAPCSALELRKTFLRWRALPVVAVAFLPALLLFMRAARGPARRGENACRRPRWPPSLRRALPALLPPPGRLLRLLRRLHLPGARRDRRAQPALLPAGAAAPRRLPDRQVHRRPGRRLDHRAREPRHPAPARVRRRRHATGGAAYLFEGPGAGHAAPTRW